jgi:threonine dehydratase
MINVLPTVADVADAYVRLRDWVVETPVLESEALNRRIGTRVLFKPSACNTAAASRSAVR